MGRSKISDERKAKNISISLFPKYHRILDELVAEFSSDKSKVIQHALEELYKQKIGEIK
jgi:hypothetical protein